MLELPLFLKGRIVAFARIDEEDSEFAKYRWHLSSSGYAVRWRDNTTIYLHRDILGLPSKATDKRRADHRDHDRLNNQRENLRIVTVAENNQNTTSHYSSTSKFRGVSWHAGRARWQAQLKTPEGKQLWLGYFTDELAASEAVIAARTQHLPFAEDAQSA